MITPQHKRLVQESFPAISDLSGPITKLFYGRLFELAPQVRPMFRQDIAVQGRKLMDMLAALVNNLDRIEALDPALRALGQRHAGYGVRPEHYATVGDALIWAFGIALAGEFTPESIRAWRELIVEVSTVMKDGADELTPDRIGSPPPQ